MSRACWKGALVACSVVALAGTAEGSNVAHMNLRDLVQRGDRIIRGTVLDVGEDTVEAGGGTLPVAVYRIRVDEVVKGSALAGDVIEVRLLSQPKQRNVGLYRRASFFHELPQFAAGRDYLFVLTKPSAIGLSTTVGFGQGLFELRGRPGQEMAIASRPGAQPVSYATLVKDMKALMAGR